MFDLGFLSGHDVVASIDTLPYYESWVRSTPEEFVVDIAANATEGYTDPLFQPLDADMAAKAVVMVQGIATNATAVTSGFAGVTWRNRGTEASPIWCVTAYRNTAATATLRVYVRLYYFSSNLVDSVQYGTVSLTGTNTQTGSADPDATISAVDLSRSVVLNLGSTTTYGFTSHMNGFPAVYFYDSDSVRIRRGGGQSSSTTTTYFCVVQFKAGKVATHHIYGLLNSGNATADVDTPSGTFDTTKSVTLFNGAAVSSNVSNGLMQTSIVDNNTVRFTRYGTTGNAYVYATVLDFTGIADDQYTAFAVLNDDGNTPNFTGSETAGGDGYTYTTTSLSVTTIENIWRLCFDGGYTAATSVSSMSGVTTEYDLGIAYRSVKKSTGGAGTGGHHIYEIGLNG